MTPDEISAAKARLEAVTPTPWYKTYNIEFEPEDEYIGNWYVSTDEDAPFRGRTSESVVADFVLEADALFIAHAPDDLRLALAEIERLKAMEARCQELSDHWRKQVFEVSPLGVDTFLVDHCADEIDAALAGSEAPDRGAEPGTRRVAAEPDRVILSTTIAGSSPAAARGLIAPPAA